jgi:predicted RNase H-like nuclease (RuvC/YqgF family)
VRYAREKRRKQDMKMDKISFLRKHIKKLEEENRMLKSGLEIDEIKKQVEKLSDNWITKKDFVDWFENNFGKVETQ